MRHRPGSADRRRVPQALGLHRQEAAPPRQEARPRGSTPVVGGGLPGQRRQAGEEAAEIHWCDEAGVAADEHPRCGYARRGQPATMEVPDPHIRVNTVSTLSNSGEAHFMTYSSTMTAALFIVFLGKLLRETTKKVYLITDRL